MPAALASPILHTLPNGLRALALPLPQAATASVSVFIASGSVHEPRALSGIGHVVEHMVFKGTARRDAHRINLDAEQLGAEVNAHTDKDHSAFHMRGLPAHALSFVPMLADLVLTPSFPADELERERQVLLQEYAEDEDDPMATAFRLFDHASYGRHPLAQPTIGHRANIERFQRDDLARWVARQFTAANTVVAWAGAGDPDAFFAEVEAAFGDMPAGTPHGVAPAVWQGGLRSRRLDAGSQSHAVLGLPLPDMAADDPAGELAALAFGEGMSAPLMAELRERRGLVYYAACSADLLAMAGEFVVEASFAPDKLAEVLTAITALLQRHAERVAESDLTRARHQMALRLATLQERPGRWLEAAVLDLLALGHVRSPAQRLAATEGVGRRDVQQGFQAMLAAGAAVGLSGSLQRGDVARAQQALAPMLSGPAGLVVAGPDAVPS
jgi:predicted Zn-dependent peptidase